MASLIGWRGMPHVFAFQFWATRGQPIPILGIAPPPSQIPVSPSMLAQYNFAALSCVCTANTAPGVLWGETVTVNIAQHSQVFEFVDVGDPVTIPGALPVEVASGATAVQVADELADEISDWIVTDIGFEAGMNAVPMPSQLERMLVTALEPAMATAMSIETTVATFRARNSATNRPYGAYVLRSAWKAFVCTGNAAPVGVVFDPQDSSMFWAVCGLVGTRGAIPRYVTPMQIFEKALGVEPEEEG